MSKSILISIKPQFVENILNGEKTIEIRKTMPKCKLPCKVYIYCTQGKRKLVEVLRKGEIKWFGKDENDRYEENIFITIPHYDYGDKKHNMLGKVVAEFTLNVVEDFECSSDDFRYLVENTKCCLTMEEVLDYCKGQDLYGWYIDDLKIYDKPKELSEFSGFIPNNKCEKHENGFACDKCDAYDKEHETCLALYYCHKPIKRPPQSWCYVEELED